MASMATRPGWPPGAGGVVTRRLFSSMTWRLIPGEPPKRTLTTWTRRKFDPVTVTTSPPFRSTDWFGNTPVSVKLSVVEPPPPPPQADRERTSASANARRDALRARLWEAEDIDTPGMGWGADPLC